jgi:hypothetical protein
MEDLTMKYSREPNIQHSLVKVETSFPEGHLEGYESGQGRTIPVFV